MRRARKGLLPMRKTIRKALKISRKVVVKSEAVCKVETERDAAIGDATGKQLVEVCVCV